jgi:phenylacetate-coenzyme A ligase PaaK-like adenylate-forming protein
MHDRQVTQPSLVVLTYENPSLLARRAIRRAFCGPVVSSYGSTEAGYVFMECEHSKLHQVSETCHVDLEPFGHTRDGREVSRVLVTTFDNPWRVLLRFDLGDLALRSSEPCACGRTHGVVLDSIEGRVEAVTRAVDGGTVTPGDLDRALLRVPGIFDYHLTQRGPREFSMSVIADTRGAERLAPRATDALRGQYGAAAFDVQVMESIPPGPSGKFKRVECAVGPSN